MHLNQRYDLDLALPDLDRVQVQVQMTTLDLDLHHPLLVQIQILPQAHPRARRPVSEFVPKSKTKI